VDKGKANLEGEKKRWKKNKEPCQKAEAEVKGVWADGTETPTEGWFGNTTTDSLSGGKGPSQK